MKKKLLMMTLTLPILVVGASRSFAKESLPSIPSTQGNAVGNLQQNVDLNDKNFLLAAPLPKCWPDPCLWEPQPQPRTTTLNSPVASFSPSDVKIEMRLS